MTWPVTGLTDAATRTREPSHSVAFLQLDLTDPEFGDLTRAAMTDLRALIEAQLRDAVGARELPRGADTTRLAEAVEVTYNGAMITWAIHGEGTLEDFMRRSLEHVLSIRRP